MPSGEEFVQGNLGYSVGRLDGSTLIVENTHIDWPYFDPCGTPLSDHMSSLEPFRVADDDSRLDHTIIATGPAIFTEPVRLEQAWQRQSGTEIYEFDCAAEWDRS